MELREWRGREGLAGLGSVEKNDEKILYGKRSFQEKKKEKNFPERRDSKYRGFEIGNFTEISMHAKHSRVTCNV